MDLDISDFIWHQGSWCTSSILARIHSTLDISAPLDSVFYACLVMGFFSLAWLSELTVHSLQAFDPSLHVKMSDVHHVCDHHGLDITVLGLPRTKACLTGEDIYFAAQSGVLDLLVHALVHHFTINSPSPSSALFSWRHSSGLRPLTQSEFLRCFKCASNRNGAIERSWSTYWWYIGISTSWCAFQHSQDHGMMEWRFIHTVPATTCCGASSIFPRYPHPQTVHSLCYASCAMICFVSRHFSP